MRVSGSGNRGGYDATVPAPVQTVQAQTSVQTVQAQTSETTVQEQDSFHRPGQEGKQLPAQPGPGQVCPLSTFTQNSTAGINFNKS